MGHSWGDPYLKRRLRFPRTFLISAYSWNYVGAVQTEPGSKLAAGEKQQGYLGHRYQQPVRSTDRCVCTCTCLSVKPPGPQLPPNTPYTAYLQEYQIESWLPTRAMGNHLNNTFQDLATYLWAERVEGAELSCAYHLLR